mmetsp:Transcript_26346/g.84407  ORF Transcript_26346/g.84407 Transcript_26346/m.84407 type:complete len:374 (+) Transcript_26346:767-1888(+)
MSAATVDVLGASELLHVLSFLPASACATMACVQRSWRDLAKEDFAWKKYLLEDFGVGALLSPEGEGGMAPATYREAYDGWRARYGRYGGMYPRARACWGRIESFLEAEFPEARESLRPGAPEAALAEAEAELGLAIPLCLRVLYGIHDGQELLFDTNLDNNRQMLDASMFWGLFGGYIFYNHAVCTRMLSLARMVRWNASLRQRGILNAHPSFLLFAASYNFQKMHFVDVDTGLVHVMRQRFRAPLQCVPTGALVAAPGGGAVGDGALRWMEEFSSRVEGGVLRVPERTKQNDLAVALTLVPPAPKSSSRAGGHGRLAGRTTCLHGPIALASTLSFTESSNLPPARWSPWTQTTRPRGGSACSSARGRGTPWR